jgi:hypothetical protein
MLRVFLFISSLFFLCQIGIAQNSYNKDTWKKQTFKKYKFIAGFDNRNSLIEQNSTSFMGLKAGVEINNRGRVGAGFYFTNKGVYATNQKWAKIPDQLFNSRTKFYYFSVFGEYIALRKIRWEISLPAHLGFGWAKERFYRLPQVTFIGKDREFVSLMELSAVVNFRTCRWFGLGLGLGYRFILNRNDLLRTSYNAPITIFRLKFYFNELYYLIKYKSEQPNTKLYKIRNKFKSKSNNQ